MNVCLSSSYFTLLFRNFVVSLWQRHRLFNVNLNSTLTYDPFSWFQKQFPVFFISDQNECPIAKSRPSFAASSVSLLCLLFLLLIYFLSSFSLSVFPYLCHCSLSLIFEDSCCFMTKTYRVSFLFLSVCWFVC